MQGKVQMVVVLRDGEEVHGVIEWYDRSSSSLPPRRPESDDLQTLDQVHVIKEGDAIESELRPPARFSAAFLFASNARRADATFNGTLCSRHTWARKAGQPGPRFPRRLAPACFRGANEKPDGTALARGSLKMLRFADGCSSDVRRENRGVSQNAGTRRHTPAG